MDGPKRKPGAGKPGGARLDKGGRLAEALRENLRKRKVQSRARAGMQAGRGGAGTPGCRPETDTETGD